MLLESGIGPLLQEISLKSDYIQIRDKVSRAVTFTAHVVELCTGSENEKRHPGEMARHNSHKS
jgi:hypothetical protein